MPQMGLGSGDLEGREGREAICTALRAGYRLIDTALFYRTEKEIAAGIRMAGLKRDQVGDFCWKMIEIEVSFDKGRSESWVLLVPPKQNITRT